MIITGIAHTPARLHERTYLPSNELVYLASKALREYNATSLITSLSLGWDQALAKAALELKIPFSVAIPYPGRDRVLKRDAQVIYYDLLAHSTDVHQVSEDYCDSAMLEAHIWRVEHSDYVLALWDYEFTGDCFRVIDFALKSDKPVANLWEDWRKLYMLRKSNQEINQQDRPHGAQVFDKG
jgi:hypothetical protein